MSNDVAKSESAGQVSAAARSFMEKVREAKLSLEPAKIIFGFDATASRQPTWNAAIPMQTELLSMFAKLGEIPPLMRLSYFRGDSEFEATDWTNDIKRLTGWMGNVSVSSGNTQITRTLEDAVLQARQGKISAVLYVGDCMEENPQTLYGLAHQLAEMEVPVYLFQEGNDQRAFQAFAEIARITGGRHVEFRQGNFNEMQDLAKVVIAKASGSEKALAAMRSDNSLTASAKQLLLTFEAGGNK